MKSVRPLHVVALLLALGVCFAPLPTTREQTRSSSLAGRLLGPVAALAASVQWVRADVAFRRGRVELFLARAETALTLAPESADGWSYLAMNQAFSLASPEREPDPARRLAWVQAGLATAAEGERVASAPGELAILAGTIMVKSASLDPDLPWPGGLAAIWEAAAGHFERAGRLGYDASMCAELAAAARLAAEHARQ